MKSYNAVFSNLPFLKPSKLSAPIFLVILSSALFACSQVDEINVTDAAEVNATDITNDAKSITNTSTVQNQPVVAMSAAKSNPDLLRNVSATVYKDANCGCCKEWVSHAEGNGLSATAQDVTDLAIVKNRYGVPDDMQSCHTAVTTDGYVFEGHVPAKYVAQFLANPPTQALGLAVPGMPMGSPGMEYQNKFDPYQIMQINKDGSSEVYADIDSPQQQL